MIGWGAQRSLRDRERLKGNRRLVVPWLATSVDRGGGGGPSAKLGGY